MDDNSSASPRLSEEKVIEYVEAYLLQKADGNWHKERTQKALSHEHGPDLVMRGGKQNTELFIIECKGKSYARNARSINRENNWIHALGQLITRMERELTIKSGKTKGQPNRSCRYGLGLYWESAQKALQRIPHEAAYTLNLYIFSVTEDGYVRQWSPKDFRGKSYPDEEFQRPIVSECLSLCHTSVTE